MADSLVESLGSNPNKKRRFNGGSDEVVKPDVTAHCHLDTILSALSAPAKAKQELTILRDEDHEQDAIESLKMGSRSTRAVRTIARLSVAKLALQELLPKIESEQKKVEDAWNDLEDAKKEARRLDGIIARGERIALEASLQFDEHDVDTMEARCATANFRTWPVETIANHFDLDDVQRLDDAPAEVFKTFLLKAHEGGLANNAHWTDMMEDLGNDGFLLNVPTSRVVWGENLSTQFCLAYIGLMLNLPGAKTSRPSVHHKLRVIRSGEQPNESPWQIDM